LKRALDEANADRADSGIFDLIKWAEKAEVRLLYLEVARDDQWKLINALVAADKGVAESSPVDHLEAFVMRAEEDAMRNSDSEQTEGDFKRVRRTIAVLRGMGAVAK
jgi:hypothetical protein